MKKQDFLERVAKIKEKLKSGKEGLLGLQQDAKALRNKVDTWKKEVQDKLHDLENQPTYEK
jgi:hypothetical protein